MEELCWVMGEVRNRVRTFGNNVGESFYLKKYRVYAHIKFHCPSRQLRPQRQGQLLPVAFAHQFRRSSPHPKRQGRVGLAAGVKPPAAGGQRGKSRVPHGQLSGHRAGAGGQRSLEAGGVGGGDAAEDAAQADESSFWMVVAAIAGVWGQRDLWADAEGILSRVASPASGCIL